MRACDRSMPNPNSHSRAAFSKNVDMYWRSSISSRYWNSAILTQYPSWKACPTDPFGGGKPDHGKKNTENRETPSKNLWNIWREIIFRNDQNKKNLKWQKNRIFICHYRFFHNRGACFLLSTDLPSLPYTKSVFNEMTTDDIEIMTFYLLGTF